MYKLNLSIIILLIVAVSTIQAQVSLTAINLPHAENFDTLANSGTTNPWANNVTILGWYSDRTTYQASTGTANAGALYSFGEASSSERALGSLGSNSVQTLLYGIRLVNNTGATITSLDISYTGEQWRNGGNAAAQSITFSYLQGETVTDVTAANYINAAGLNFTSPITGATSAALNGNLPENSSSITSSLIVVIPPGEEIMLRWTDINDAGNDHALAIDDLVITPRLTVTSAPVSVSGRVTSASGRGISGARISVAGSASLFAITNQLGYYRIEGLTAGSYYVLNVSARRNVFSTPAIVVDTNQELNDIDFVANN